MILIILHFTKWICCILRIILYLYTRASQAEEIAVYKSGYVNALDMDNGTIARSMKFDGDFLISISIYFRWKAFMFMLDKTYKMKADTISNRT
jgi:hypothetical protein